MHGYGKRQESAEIRDLVSRYSEDPDAVFVLPSEAAAAFWRKEALRTIGRTEIDPDRFLGWETFKDRLFARTGGNVPVGTARRTLFAASILRENRRAPFLSELIDHRFADASLSFLRPLRKLLPFLKEIAQRGSAIPEPAGGSGRMIRLVEECRQLSLRYDSFLSRHGLFEPIIGAPDGARGDQRFFLVYPEVIDDYPDFRASVERLAEIVPVPVPEMRPVPMLRFQTVLGEMRSVLRRVESLLDEGVEPDRIMISVAGLDEWSEHLEAEAALREIPLDVRRSRPLFRFPGGRLFPLIAELVDSDFSLSSMKAFLLNRGIPIRRQKDARELVRIGIEGHCIRNYRSGGVYRDLWERALIRKEEQLLRRAAESSGAVLRRKAGRISELNRFYRTLRRSVRRIARAATFRALRTALDDFCTYFLAVRRWDGVNLSVFYRGMEVLEEFVRAEEALDGELPGRPFRIWMGALNEEYCAVPSLGDGIPVYGYRVSAGIEPEHHFIIGATQEATRTVSETIAMLGDEAKDLLGFADRDVSEALLGLYTRSGDAVRFSFSSECFGGPGLAPGFFVSRKLVRDAGPEETDREADPLFQEREIWAGAGVPFPERIYPVQRTGFSFMLRTGFSGKRIDFVRHPVEAGELLEAGLRILSDERGYLRLSWTHLEEFLSCPFAFFFRRVLGLPDGREEEMLLSDPRSFGTLAHEVLEAFFIEVRTRHARFRPGALEEYRELLGETGRSVLARWGDQKSAPIEPVLAAGGSGLMDSIMPLLEAEADAFPDHLVEGVEAWYGFDLHEERIHLFGKIDRISCHPETGEAVLIDYKMNVIPSRKAVTSGEGDVLSFQIPFYVFLARGAGLQVRAACYYRIRRGEYVHVFLDGDVPAGRMKRTGPWMDREGLGECIEGMLRNVRESAERIRAGVFSVPSEGGGCAGCPLRPLCRVKYMVR